MRIFKSPSALFSEKNAVRNMIPVRFSAPSWKICRTDFRNQNEVTFCVNLVIKIARSPPSPATDVFGSRPRKAWSSGEGSRWRFSTVLQRSRMEWLEPRSRCSVTGKCEHFRLRFSVTGKCEHFRLRFSVTRKCEHFRLRFSVTGKCEHFRLRFSVTGKCEFLFQKNETSHFPVTEKRNRDVGISVVFQRNHAKLSHFRLRFSVTGKCEFLVFPSRKSVTGKRNPGYGKA